MFTGKLHGLHLGGSFRGYGGFVPTRTDTTPPSATPVTVDPLGPARSPLRAGPTGTLIERLQRLAIGLLVDVLVVLVLVTLVWMVIGVAGDVWTAVTERTADAFKSLSIELLTVFIFIELFHSLAEYARVQRVRVTHLLDASLAFVLREVWVGMYGGHLDSVQLLALAALVIALGGVRTLAVIHSPGERASEHDGAAGTATTADARAAEPS